MEGLVRLCGGGEGLVAFSCTSFVASWQVEFLSGRIWASHFHSLRVFGLVDVDT